MVFLQSCVIMPGGRLPETENKGMYQNNSGPKSGCGRFGNLGTVVVAYERVFETD